MPVIDNARIPGRRRAAQYAALLVLLLAVGAVAVPHGAGAAQVVAPQDLLARAASAVGVVRGTISNRTVTGTAFVIDREGWLLTASHVVHGAQALRVDLPGTAPLDARVVGYDAPRDLALLRVSPAGPLPALEVAGGSLRVGDPVAAIGAPANPASSRPAKSWPRG